MRIMQRTLAMILALLLVISLSACKRVEGKAEAAKIVVKEVAKECPPCPCEKKDQAESGEPQAPLTDKDGPEQSILYHLTDMYSPVKFAHRTHAQYAQGCTDCHHHHSGVERTPACRECHGLASSTTLSKPGLKGAYHRQCMNCHRQMSGPLMCEACHAKRTDKSETVQKIAAENAPEKVTLGHISHLYKPVTFDHRLHSALTDSCIHCHHQQGEVEMTPPCRECHNTVSTTDGAMKLGLKDAYHEQCRNCHRGKGEGPLGCTDCHAKKSTSP